MARVMKPTMLISFFQKKYANEFIRVKTVIKLDFQDEKTIFIVYMSKM